MKTWLIAACIAALGTTANAGAIGKACPKSDRQAANRSLCDCIQQVADLTLSNSDQRRAAKFFKDPQLAQDTRQAKGTGNNAFWAKYKDFGATAEVYCSLAR